MNRKPTIKEFARLLGVSTATVSRAFNRTGRISEATRQRIVAKARELGYQPNIHARSLSQGQSGAVGLFYPSISDEEPDYFLTEILLGINRSLQRLGRSLQIHPFPFQASAEAMDACRGRIQDGSFSGIIIVAGARGSQELVEAAESNGLAYVVVGRMSGLEGNAVLLDNERGALLAGTYFRNTGRRHPAYIGGSLDRRKKRGFCKGLGRAEDEIVVAEGGSSFRQGSLAFEAIRDRHPEVDCVLCANDVLAIGFVKAALSHGLRIPADIAVVGFDDIRPSRYMTPALSSVSLRLVEIGERAVEMLARRLGGEGPVRAETVECDLILRESS